MLDELSAKSRDAPLKELLNDSSNTLLCYTPHFYNSITDGFPGNKTGLHRGTFEAIEMINSSRVRRFDHIYQVIELDQFAFVTSYVETISDLTDHHAGPDLPGLSLRTVSRS